VLGATKKGSYLSARGKLDWQEAATRENELGGIASLHHRLVRAVLGQSLEAHSRARCERTRPCGCRVRGKPSVRRDDCRFIDPAALRTTTAAKNTCVGDPRRTNSSGKVPSDGRRRWARPATTRGLRTKRATVQHSKIRGQLPARANSQHRRGQGTRNRNCGSMREPPRTCHS